MWQGLDGPIRVKNIGSEMDYSKYITRDHRSWVKVKGFGQVTGGDIHHRMNVAIWDLVTDSWVAPGKMQWSLWPDQWVSYIGVKKRSRPPFPGWIGCQVLRSKATRITWASAGCGQLWRAGRWMLRSDCLLHPCPWGDSQTPQEFPR